jgi:peptide deformylase
MILPIYVYGSPVLRKPTEDVTEDYEGLKGLVDDMFETMYSSDGVGLAAPQVGKSIRMFVVDVSNYADEDKSLAGFKKVFINPEIYEESDDEVLMGEGCLSVPGLNEEVWRPDWVRIKYLDENFQPHDDRFEGFAARVVQHEYDHLDGELFVDRLAPLRKTLLKSKLNAMSKGKFTARYKTKISKN